MNCELLERYVDAYVDAELDPSVLVDFERHLGHCARCQDEVAAVRATKSLTREALRGPGASDALRERLARALDAVDDEALRASAAPPAPRDGVRWLVLPPRVAVPLAAAAALVFAVAGALDLRIGADTGTTEAAAMPVFEDVVKLHASSLPADVTGAEPQQVSTFFRDKVAFPVRPVFEGNEARLVGARLSHVRERQAAALYYNVRGSRLTVVVFEDPQSRLSAPRTQFMGRDLYLMQVRGRTVPVVRRGPVVYAFAGDVDRATLLRLAAAARVP